MLQQQWQPAQHSRQRNRHWLLVSYRATRLLTAPQQHFLLLLLLLLLLLSLQLLLLLTVLLRMLLLQLLQWFLKSITTCSLR
jgi:hypothetical protein